MQFNQLLNGPEGTQVAAYLSNLETVRVSVFQSDTLRSLFFVLAAALLIYAFVLKKIKAVWLVTATSLLILVDMYGVNRRYLNNDNFIKASKAEVPFQASKANQFILRDTDPDYRVLDITQSTFNDASTSYFHKSIGGYHGAKLQRYQDVIEYYLQPEMQQLIQVLSKQPTLERINQAFYGTQVLNMLNTKYVIYNPEAQPLINPAAFGAAWFVDSVVMVSSADEEIEALGQYDLRNTAIVDDRFSGVLADLIVGSIDGLIEVVDYQPNRVKYQTQTSMPGLAVFSEVYFANGWNVYMDGQPVSHLRANYILRALPIPAGNHSVEFKFEPRVWSIGEAISLVSSLIILLLIVAGVAIFARKHFFSEKKR
jgi:hypothetical protein